MPLRFQLKQIFCRTLSYSALILFSAHCKLVKQPASDTKGQYQSPFEQGWSVRVTYDTFFKTSPDESILLKPADKCKISKGTKLPILAKPLQAAQQHFFVAFDPSTLGKSCPFAQGYLFLGHIEILDAQGKLFYSSGYGQYAYPVDNGYPTSFWCSCRNLPGATSPHVGQDVGVINTNQKSMAVAQSTVTNVYLSSWSCGYTVELKDDAQTVWRYVHLNRPWHLKIGQRLAKGAYVGLHKSYPKAGCGKGAHLHLERRTQGTIWQDKSKMKDCGRGLRSCYFDPNKPFEQLAPSKNPAAQNLGAALIYQGASNPYSGAAAYRELTKPDPDAVFSAQSWPPRDGSGRLLYPNPYNDDASDVVDDTTDESQIRMTDVGQGQLGFRCQKSQSLYVESHEPIKPTGADLRTPKSVGILVSLKNQEGATATDQRLIHASFQLGDNASNVCKENQDCIVSWELHVGSNGKWQKVTEQPAARNQPVTLHADQGFCVSAHGGNTAHPFWLTGKTAWGHPVHWIGAFDDITD